MARDNECPWDAYTSSTAAEGGHLEFYSLLQPFSYFWVWKYNFWIQSTPYIMSILQLFTLSTTQGNSTLCQLESNIPSQADGPHGFPRLHQEYTTLQLPFAQPGTLPTPVIASCSQCRTIPCPLQGSTASPGLLRRLYHRLWVSRAWSYTVHIAATSVTIATHSSPFRRTRQIAFISLITLSFHLYYAILHFR